ncbi:MAG: RluA family pseudouridine synthase [Deltaproteobacteria bacterium]|nr:RluA family pseudouridine synthase [Deltaproteobacteria bacterium]
MEHTTEKVFPSLEDRGERLDVFLSRSLGSVSREKIKSIIKEGNAAINGAVVGKPDYKIKGNESIEVHIPVAVPSPVPPPEPINIPIMYEDDYIIIIDKPPGVSTHPTSTALHRTVVNALLYMDKQLSNMGDPLRRGIVHRLDKQTEGILIIAKSNDAHMKLLSMFKYRTVHKAYIAVVYNVMVQDSGTINGLIGRHPVDRKRMTTKTAKGKEAVTYFRAVKRLDNGTVVLLSPKTGRTHQLRAQLSDMGYPIINDDLYSRKRRVPMQPRLRAMLSAVDGIALFAYAVSFLHPIYGVPVTFSAPFPAWLKAVLSEHELYQR